jgi:hypothetical protein
MVDPRRASDVNEAAARFADALAESYRIVYGQAAEAQERQARFAQDFSERVLDHLKEQAESGRAASEQLADQARRQQEAGRELAQESVNAYWSSSTPLSPSTGGPWFGPRIRPREPRPSPRRASLSPVTTR